MDDGDRALTKEGKEKTKNMAALLDKVGLKITDIVSSPFLRAVETAEILKKTLNFKNSITLTEDLLPERNFTDFMSYIKKRSKLGEVTVFVGHEPNLSHLVSRILGAKQTFVELKKSGFAILEVDTVDDISAGNARLQVLSVPKLA